MASNDTDESFQKNAYDEILNSLIYVFTPKGDVMELPQGATPIDFAYRIHSGVGDKTVGAIVISCLIVFTVLPKVTYQYFNNKSRIVNINI